MEFPRTGRTYATSARGFALTFALCNLRSRDLRQKFLFAIPPEVKTCYKVLSISLIALRGERDPSRRSVHASATEF